MNSTITDIKLKGECILDRLYAGNERIIENAEINIYDINKTRRLERFGYNKVINGDGHRDEISAQSVLEINNEFYYIECQTWDYSVPLGVFAVPEYLYERLRKILKLRKSITGDVLFKRFSNDNGDVLVGSMLYESMSIIEAGQVVFCAFRKGWYGALINKYGKDEGCKDDYPWLEVNIKKFLGIAVKVLLPLLYLIPDL